MYSIETKHLVHLFPGGEKALDNVSLQVPQGSIYGFLGPNGAGKTTTLRLILGLLKKQQGEVFIDGRSMEHNRIPLLRTIGSLIESPSIYSHLTATENLAVLQKIYRCPRSRIHEVLELVGLSDTGNKKAGRFSLGMKQRLGIAIALLNAPSLLILDEPTNGLDPNGIIEMRELLKRLNREMNMTVLVSSHLLPEIEKLVTHVGIINKGRIMFQGTLQQLILRQQQAAFTSIETGDNLRALQLTGFEQAQQENGRLLLPLLSRDAVAETVRRLVQANIDVYSISTARNDLETIFMDLINN